MVINGFLTGYDVISITTTHFNSTPGSRLPMWHLGRTKVDCYPHQFQLGDTFRTNISAFSYSIFDVTNSSWLSCCYLVEQTSPVLPFAAEGDLGLLLTCSIEEAYQEIYRGLYKTVDDGTNALIQHVYKVIAEGQPHCDKPSSCNVPEFTTYNAIGNIDLNILPNASSIAADEGNLYNVITIFYAAVRLDLGHWTGDNVFTNTTSFKRLIRDTDVTNTTFRSVAASKGMAYANFITPPSANVSTSPAVIQIPYTCNLTQRKPIASFIVSVVSATLSMFLGTWGVIVTILSTVVRRNPEANTCQHPQESDKEEHTKSISLQYIPLSKSDSSY
ncbi:hypothetical protein C8J57DRAFT_1475768 [Mycena rebaudengoi]|nr:hypothetical protein C8J57DRAFT_1475768 [Mycena rebaudengoi]